MFEVFLLIMILMLLLKIASAQNIATYIEKLIRESPSLFFAKLNSDFAKDLYPAILQVTRNNNAVISPLFLQSCIALTYTASSGKTAIELARALKLPENGYNVKKPIQQLLQKYANTPYFYIANKIWIGLRVKLKSGFSKVITKNFCSEVEIIDFTNPYKVAEILDDWVSQKTNNKILHLVEWMNINPATNMVLVNATYFGGIWEKGFNEEDTTEKDFWLSDQESVKVPIMYQTGFFKFGFIKKLDATALEMKYSNSDIWMLVILPETKNGLDHIEKQLKHKDLHQISRGLKTKCVEVFLPKFKIECDMDLKLPLIGMGMGSIFEKPDFSNMIDENQIKVDKIIHKVVLDVNEKGTHIIDGIRKNECTERFNANRPFFFAIKSDCAILFTGRYVNNGKSEPSK